jgi:hypothetical protein
MPQPRKLRSSHSTKRGTGRSRTCARTRNGRARSVRRRRGRSPRGGGARSRPRRAGRPRDGRERRAVRGDPPSCVVASFVPSTPGLERVRRGTTHRERGRPFTFAFPTAVHFTGRAPDFTSASRRGRPQRV